VERAAIILAADAVGSAALLPMPGGGGTLLTDVSLPIDPLAAGGLDQASSRRRLAAMGGVGSQGANKA
jgi:hypothetical protein